MERRAMARLGIMMPYGVASRCIFDSREIIMRTTVTLDSDVKTLLTDFAYRSGKSFKAALNDAVRAGLAKPKVAAVRRKPPEFPTYDMGEPLVDLTKALALAAELEDQEYIAKFERGA
jgi:hypothetical protein